MKFVTTFLTITFLFSSNAFAFSPFNSSKSRVCKNDRVVFDNHFSGSVVEVFNNNTVKISSDYHNSYQIRDIRDIGVAKRCVEKVCVKSRVNFDNIHTGSITEIYDNGIVKISSDNHNSYQYRRIQEIGVENRCVENLCKNNRVNFDHNFVGSVVEVFDNGIAKISSDSHNPYQYRNIQALGIARKCISQLCVRDRVSFDYSLSGSISEIFDNGIVKISSDSHNAYQFRQIQELDAGVRCSTSKGPRMICN